MPRFRAVALICAMSVAGSAACATKKYVQTTTDELAVQMMTLNNAVEDIQEQTRKHDEQIKSVDTSVQAVRQTAQQASQAAQDATSVARRLETRTAAIEESGRRLIYETVLRQDDLAFGFDESNLSEAAKTELKALVDALKQEKGDLLIVLEGHTDSTGPESVNDRVGMERARAVERYLYEEEHIPLQKMDVISYGESKPVAPNTTREGRAQNRRVVIKVMS